MKKIWWILILPVTLLIILVAILILINLEKQGEDPCKKLLDNNMISIKQKKDIPKIQNQFQVEDNKKVLVYPVEREIFIDKGESCFAFKVKNSLGSEKNFSYVIRTAEIIAGCSFTKEETNLFLNKTSGNFDLESNETSNLEWIKIQVPKSSEKCKIRYLLEVREGEGNYSKTYLDLVM